MTVTYLKAFALAPVDTGCRNQILGAFRALNDLTGEQDDIDSMLVLPEDVPTYLDIKNSLCYSQLKNIKILSKKYLKD